MSQKEFSEDKVLTMLKKVVIQARISGKKEGSSRLFGKDDFTEVIREAEELLRKYEKNN
ncbi:hypothetical protein D3C87_82440 [compost metagenome]